jgi:triosephosphate isomerase
MKYLCANWKMAMTQSGIDEFFSRFSFSKPDVQTILFPSYVHLSHVHHQIQAQPSQGSLQWGAQDCSTEKSGAFTGEISAAQIQDLGATWVMIGHSERRQRTAETAQTLSAKWDRATEAGLNVLFCVGESLEQRKAGQTLAVIESQIAVVGSRTSFLLAYEPVWSIGTGLVPCEKEIEEVHLFLKKRLGSQTLGILYGGSVKTDNANALAAINGVDGFLVGGASLTAASFQEVGSVFNLTYPDPSFNR